VSYFVRGCRQSSTRFHLTTTGNCLLIWPARCRIALSLNIIQSVRFPWLITIAEFHSIIIVFTSYFLH
jgi:hypothetical protein